MQSEQAGYSQAIVTACSQWYHHYLKQPLHTHLEETINAVIYWKGKRSTIWSITKSCKTCQVNKRRTRKYGLLLSKIIISTPWETLCINLGAHTHLKVNMTLQQTSWLLPWLTRLQLVWNCGATVTYETTDQGGQRKRENNWGEIFNKSSDWHFKWHLTITPVNVYLRLKVFFRMTSLW